MKRPNFTLYPSESQLDQDTPSDSPEPTEPDTYTDLWRDMVDYNKEKSISMAKKGWIANLRMKTPVSFWLTTVWESEVFAVISIPALAGDAGVSGQATVTWPMVLLF